MIANLLYAVGTLALWAGWALVARAAYLALLLILKDPARDRARTLNGLFVAAAIGGACLALGMALPMQREGASDAIDLPLVWFVMPFVAWGVAGAAVMAIVRLLQGWLALSHKETIDRLLAGGIWALAAGAFYYLFSRDPEHKIEILKGSIPVSATFVVTVVTLVVAGALAMVLAARWTRSRGFVKAAMSQVALIAGSIVFGLPFAFLVITSFKEDRDMSSPQGIVWIPKVQETVAYNDPKNPLFEIDREGQRVTGTILEKLADGKVRVEIEEPRAIRGTTFEADPSTLKEIPRQKNLVSAKLEGKPIKAMVVEDLEDGGQRVLVLEPQDLKGKEATYKPGETEPIRHVGLRTQNYTEALSFLPPETNYGLVYIKNTLILVVLSVVGTLLSSSIVAYAFSRMTFPGRDFLFVILLSTMMLPAAVTMLPQFLIFRWFGWIDTLYPLWVPAFFASAFNVFLLRQFFKQIPLELEDAAKIDGASYPRTFWSVMLPQIKPALAVIAIGTFMGAWNNFMGPLIYINSPENMPLSYALQLFQGDRGGEPGLLMAFATLTIIPVLLVFFFAQRYFIEGVTLSGFGGR